MDETKLNTAELSSGAHDKSEVVIALLLSGKSMDQISAQLGIGRTTLWRLRNSQHFRRAYREAKEALLASAVDALYSHAMDFVDVTHQIAMDNKVQPSVRLIACRDGLAAMFRAREITDLYERLKTLESALESEGLSMDGQTEGTNGWVT